MFARIIRKALEILNGKTGIEWVKGEMGFLDAKFDSEPIESMLDLTTEEASRVASVCTLGALELATRFEGGNSEDYEKIARFVAKVGGNKGIVTAPAYAPGRTLTSTDVAAFNDKPETTQNDVVGLLRSALKEAEALPLAPLEPALA